ncbi:MAG: SpoIIE family protein phosphatase, partial [Melioribacteraceae bacterium]
MKILIRARGLENAILISVLLFLFNLVFPQHNSTVLFICSEILVFLTVFFLYNYIYRFLNSKVDSPFSLVINAGILAALIFFIVSVVKALLGTPGSSNGARFFNSLFSVLLTFVFIGAIVYIFSTFRELFFLRQKKDPSIYFNTMLVFFALSYFSNILLKFDPTFDYPKDAFYVVTIVLIFLNSLRVSWIAFLTKRQKYYLLIISIVLSILFGMNYAIVIENNIVRQLLYAFSPGLHTFIDLLMIYGTINFGVIFFTTLFHLPTAEAFDHKAEEVSSLMDLTKLITQVFDFKELAETITSSTTKICNTDSAWLVTRVKDEIELNSVHNIGYVEADKITKAILEGEDYEIFDVTTIHPETIKIAIKNDVRTFNFKSIAVAPLKVHNNINGYLFTARQHDFSFNADEIKSIGAFADFASVALENAKLIKESIEKERLEKEFDVARDIQRKILPSTIPSSDQLHISALFVPAFEVGGDYYDFFELDKDRLGFVVADVSGKGISAAFIMAEVKGIFESLSKLIFNPRELLINVNNILKNSLDKKSFVTAIYGVINKKTGVLNFARAGHTPIHICSGETIERLQPPGIGLGLDFTTGFA